MAVSFVLFFVSVLVLSGRVESEPVQDKQALLRFINGTTQHPNQVQWDDSVPVCNWTGVDCDANRSFVSAIHLPGAGLVGPIRPNTLGLLRQLRVLNLRANDLNGEIPSDFSNLTNLLGLYLQSNNFSGSFPESVTRLGRRLCRLDLSSNNFTGPIPVTVNNLIQLTGLFLENNNFSGNLSRMNLVHLLHFNVSNNNLKGRIPRSLAKFNKSAFTGNPDLCGRPLRSCAKLPTRVIIAIAVGSTVVALPLPLFLIPRLRRQLWELFLILCLRRRPPKQQKSPVPVVPRPVTKKEATSSSKDDITCESAKAEGNRQVLCEEAAEELD